MYCARIMAGVCLLGAAAWAAGAIEGRVIDAQGGIVPGHGSPRPLWGSGRSQLDDQFLCPSVARSRHHGRPLLGRGRHLGPNQWV